MRRRDIHGGVVAVVTVVGTSVAMVVGGSEGWRYGIEHTPVFGCGCFNPVGGLIVFIGGLVGMLAGCVVGAAVPALLGLTLYIRRHRANHRTADFETGATAASPDGGEAKWLW